MGSRGQAVMIVECEKMATGSNFGMCTLISDIEILSGTDERNRPRNMSASEFTHWLLELCWLTDLNPRNNITDYIVISNYDNILIILCNEKTIQRTLKNSSKEMLSDEC